MSFKKSRLHFNVHVFFLKNDSCATKVVLQHALQLVASKLPAKVASCDKALTTKKHRSKVTLVLLILCLGANLELEMYN